MTVCPSEAVASAMESNVLLRSGRGRVHGHRVQSVQGASENRGESCDECSQGSEEINGHAVTILLILRVDDSPSNRRVRNVCDGPAGSTRICHHQVVTPGCV